MSTATKWNSKVMLPTDSNYICRVTGADFGPSKSSGNPMITLNWEIASPGEVEIGGNMVNIAGVKPRPTYHTVAAMDAEGEVDEEKTAIKHTQIKELYEKFGLTSEDIGSMDNPDTSKLLGKACYCLVKAKVTEQRKPPTAAQVEAAKKAGNKFAQGDVMKNPVTGKDLVDYWPEITEIFGLALTGSVAAPY